MQPSALIGTSVRIKGQLTAQEDVVISGRLEGSITVKGHRVTVSAGAEVVADIQAAEVVIAGQVLGTVSAERRIELTATADAEGELHAPAIYVVEGAVFQGRLETQAARAAGLRIAS